MFYRYKAIIEKHNDIYTVEFPDFGLKGRGMHGYDETLSFAQDYLAEIIMAYQKESRPLPRMVSQSETPNTYKPYAREVMVEVEPDLYRDRIRKNAGRVFYEFESDEDVAERNKPAFAGSGKIAAAVIGVIILIVIVLVFRHGV